MTFSTVFLTLLIKTALVWTALGAVVLVVLLLRDWRRGQLW